MTGYKISVGTGILFYIIYPRPPVARPPPPKTPPANSRPPSMHSYRITTFFSITVANMQRQGSTANSDTPRVRQNPEILFF